MAECREEGLPPDINSTESERTEADSEFISDEQQNDQVTESVRDGNQDENSTESSELKVDDTLEECLPADKSPEENASELERTESSGNVRDDLLTADHNDADNTNEVPGQDVDNEKCGQHVADVQTPDSNCSDDIQCLAEEDRDNVSPQASPEGESSEVREMHSSQAIPDNQADSLPESLLQPSERQENIVEHSSETQSDNDIETDGIQFESAETENNEDNATVANVQEDSAAKEVDLPLLEPDQPECDINSNTDDNEGEQSACHPSVRVDTAGTSAETEGSSVQDSNDGLMAASNIPRVSSHGELGQIQNSVQALIDKTSGFLDSDPPSTMSSMSDLDQAGLDALSSTKVFDNLRRDTPSPRAQSPQQAAATNPSQTSSVLDLQAQAVQGTPSSSQEQSKASHDSSCLPASLNTNSSNSVQKPRTPNTQTSDADEDLLSQLDAELHSDDNGNTPEMTTDVENPNGLIQRNINLSQIPEYKKLLYECEMLRKQTDQQQQQIKSLQDRESHQSVQLESVSKERDSLKSSLSSLQGKSTDEIYQAQMKETPPSKETLESFIAFCDQMEATIAQQTKELIQTKDKLASHDAAAKRAVQTLQTELKKRVDEITKMYEETKKEKDAMVMKYAMSEQKSIEATEKMSKSEIRMREIAKEREIMIQRFTQLKKNREAALAALEARNKDVTGLKKEIEVLKDAVQSHEMKAKWAHNKLKVEELGHKETKSKLDELQRKLNEQREEALILRQDCQAMIKTYQESEEIKSSTLDQELKKKTNELQQQMAAKTEVEEVHTMLRKELDSLKVKHKDMIAELKTYKDKVQCLETERRHQEKSLDAFKETLQSQKQNNETMKARLLELETVEEDMLSVKERNKRVMDRNDELEQSNRDLQAEMDGCARREQEHLEFTKNISEKNSSLQSENTTLTAKVKGLAAEVERLSAICENLEKKNVQLEKELAEEKKQRKEEYETLSAKLAEKSRAAEQLAIEVEDQKDENKTLKRRHTANVKDLSRQLQQTKKKLEMYENKEAGKETTSMGSRTSSTTSLETMNNQHGGVVKTPTEPTAPEMQEYPEVRVIEVDKQMLIEKIVKLQKAHARKSEKIEFMDDHINQLLEEVKKKSKIIQMYALREESGTLVPESVDNNKNSEKHAKAALAKKTGIMASLYSTHQQDGAMTLELSLEINKKLQAVLEDTLLKNITIKDNLETLGREIARLSQENRQLQLEMQALKKS